MLVIFDILFSLLLFPLLMHPTTAPKRSLFYSYIIPLHTTVVLLWLFYYDGSTPFDSILCILRYSARVVVLNSSSTLYFTTVVIFGSSSYTTVILICSLL